MDQLFIIVDRDIYGHVNILQETDLMTAIAKQKSILLGLNMVQAKAIIKEEEINQIINNLKNDGRDILSNDEEEVIIFLLPKK